MLGGLGLAGLLVLLLPLAMIAYSMGLTSVVLAGARRQMGELRASNARLGQHNSVLAQQVGELSAEAVRVRRHLNHEAELGYVAGARTVLESLAGASASPVRMDVAPASVAAD